MVKFLKIHFISNISIFRVWKIYEDYSIFQKIVWKILSKFHLVFLFALFECYALIIELLIFYRKKIIDYTYISLISVLSEPQTPAHPLDYNFAREEFMLNELSNDPIQTAIAKMEKQHEEDKQGYHQLPR